METLKGYTLVGSWRTTPHGAVCRATRGGERYLVKRFPNRYPGAELAGYPRAFLGKLAEAQRCWRRAEGLWQALGGARAARGNLNVPVAVFRHGGYVYKVVRFVRRVRVGGTALTVGTMHRLLTGEQVDTVLRSILAQQALLERAGVVHNDYKPENVILTQRSPGVFVGCVIDYDSGFFAGRPPVPQDVVGALEYASPELLRYLARDKYDRRLAERVGCASDVFSLGVVFYECLTGRQLCDELWRWPAERILKRLPVDLGALDERHRRVVRAMLHPDPDRRPRSLDALRMLA